MHSIIARATILLLVAAAACGGGSSDNSGTGGDSGGTGGAGGDSGSGGAMGSTFQAVPPCLAETDFVAGQDVALDATAMTATPACLKAAVATPVTFTITGGDFSTFPLEASRKRGDTADNPIGTAYGTTYTVVPGVPGFLGYYVPGASSDTSGTRMAGVIWVAP